MIGCLRTCVLKQPIIALYFEFETVLKFHNLEDCFYRPRQDDSSQHNDTLATVVQGKEKDKGHPPTV